MATAPRDAPALVDCLQCTSSSDGAHVPVIAFVGGGGKTSLMFACARQLCSRGRRVLCTTTTKMMMPSEGTDVDQIIVGGDGLDSTARAVDEAFRAGAGAGVATGADVRDGTGVSPDRESARHGWRLMLISGVLPQTSQQGPHALASFANKRTGKHAGDKCGRRHNRSSDGVSDGCSAAAQAQHVREAIDNNSGFGAAPHAARRQKVNGVPTEWVSRLSGLSSCDAVLVEADGSRRLPFKAPAAHEPVLPANATCVVAIAGADALNRALDGQVAHRIAELSALTGVREGGLISPECVARVIGHRAVWGVDPSVRFVACVNKVDEATVSNPAQRLAADLVAQHVMNRGDADAILLAGQGVRGADGSCGARGRIESIFERSRSVQTAVLKTAT